MSDFEAKHPMVRVEWDDSMRVSGWTTEEVMRGLKVLPCVSVGWLIEDSAEAVKVACSWDGDGEVPSVTGGMVIPRSAVRKVDYLRNDGRPEPPGEAITTNVTAEELGPFNENVTAPPVEPEMGRVVNGKRGFFSFLPWAG